MVSFRGDPKPAWLKVRPPGGEDYARLRKLFRKHDLHTVCEEARCPNQAECWGHGTATIMLLGDTCTRACRFCDVKTGKPNGVLDREEPMKVAATVAELKLKYVVLTSVDRDDLADGGADHFGRTVEQIKKMSPGTLVEVLIPDFQADQAAVLRIASCGADVIGHNVETVRRLSRQVRDRRCDYERSLRVLGELKVTKAIGHTKSSIMVGLGETIEEVHETMDDLRGVGVDILTIGQYLRPSRKQLPVAEYVSPEQFREFEKSGVQRGFLFVSSGPLVRSSYYAGERFVESLLRP